MRKINNNKKGISLIVLIVTIAVIIILTTVVIVTVSNNRPIESAKEAKNMHNESVLLENAEVLSTQYTLRKRLDGISRTREEYVRQSLIEKEFSKEQVERVDVNEQTGRVTLDTVTAKEVAQDPSKYYGVYVTNYEAENAGVVGWRVFYSDEKNIYLIADDYIPYESIPYSTKDGKQTNNKPEKVDKYKVSFKNIINDYKGSDNITDIRLRNLNSKYFEYLSTNNKKSEDSNMKAVAYLMDTDAWKIFAGKYAEYAIGAPTLELVVCSWNNMKFNLKIEYSVEDTEYMTNIYGYVYRVLGEDNWAQSIGTKLINEENIDNSNNLYRLKDYSKANAFWLASPSAPYKFSLSMVKCDGYFGGNLYSSDAMGLRPLICIKSDIVLREETDGTYKLM